ncbi:hypothetical protein ACIQUL_29725 [Streptomyces sp. NPDC090303]|uniref:hypothetical protein n=1 Tax=Streptomyces sp. NPDC090303 TaxID=3365960 RepID=UPI0038191A68
MNTDEVWNYLAELWVNSGREHWWDFTQDCALLPDEELNRMMAYFSDFAVYYAHHQRPDHMEPADYQAAVELLFRDWYEKIYVPYTVQEQDQEQQAAVAAYDAQVADWDHPQDPSAAAAPGWTEPQAQEHVHEEPAPAWDPTQTWDFKEETSEEVTRAEWAAELFDAFAQEGTALPEDIAEILGESAELGAEEIDEDTMPTFA